MKRHRVGRGKRHEFSLSSGHQVTVDENAVGQWRLLVWAGDRYVGDAYGPGAPPSKAEQVKRAEGIVQRARLWERSGI